MDRNGPEWTWTGMDMNRNWHEWTRREVMEDNGMD